MTALWAIGLTVTATLLGACGALLLKIGAAAFSFHPARLIRNWQLLAGITLYVLATALFIPALKGGELSVLYPLISLSYVWVSLLSVRFLRERMNRWKWTGIIFILLGVSIIGIARAGI